MKIHDVAQNSLAWLQVRAGIPTASEFDNLITPEWKARTGQTPKSYLCRKLGEWWTGMPLAAQLSSFAMEQGKIIEDEARPAASLELGIEIKQVGFITSDEQLIGCSPDGLADGFGVEIKCLQPAHHVQVLIDNELPKEFYAQVYGSMLVTGFDEWVFYAYQKQFPSLLIHVYRDKAIMAKIKDVLTDFIETFEGHKERFIQIHGEPPNKQTKYVEPDWAKGA